MKVISQNKKAKSDYFISNQLEAGIVLVGSEIKSILKNGVNLKESYVKIINNEVFLINANIDDTDEKLRPKKLLLHKKQIKVYEKLLKNPGTTLLVTSVYVGNSGKVKCEVVLGKGKKQYDKRQAIKERDLERQQ